MKSRLGLHGPESKIPMIEGESKEDYKIRRRIWGLNRRVRESQKNPAYQRARLIKHRYKISEEEYDSLFNKQNGKCSICGRELHLFDNKKTTTSEKACLDHCHLTGKIRGFLCFKCNSMIGLAGDRIEVLSKGIEYLQKHSS